MKYSSLIAGVLLLAVGAVYAQSNGKLANGELISTKQKGVVSVLADPALSDGRLVLRLVAFNNSREPAAFGVSNVHIQTAAGKPVELMPLERLVADIKAAASQSSARSMNNAHQSSNYSRPVDPRNRVGELDVTGHTGANDSFDREVSARATADEPLLTEMEANQQIAQLEAGILRMNIVQPAGSAGGQVVTQRLRLKRKEERSLRVAVDFNGERHEFSVPAPKQDRSSD